MPRMRTALLCAALLMSAAPLVAVPAAHAAAGAAARRGPTDCAASPAPVPGPAGDRARAVADAVAKVRHDLKLRSVITRVTQDGRDVWTGALGPSMTGVPARTDMRFRAGSVGIAFMGVMLMQLVDEKRVSLDRPDLALAARGAARRPDHARDARRLHQRHPGLRQEPRLRGRAAGASVQAVDAPGAARHWRIRPTRSTRLARTSATRTPTTCCSARPWSASPTPGSTACCSSASTARFGLRATSNSFTPDIPAPALHAFTTARGPYEESTFWNPSWTTAPGAVITMDVCDLARAGQGVGWARR